MQQNFMYHGYAIPVSAELHCTQVVSRGKTNFGLVGLSRVGVVKKVHNRSYVESSPSEVEGVSLPWFSLHVGHVRPPW